MCLHAALPKDFVKGLLPKLTALLPGGSSRNCKAMVLRELQLNIKTSWGRGRGLCLKKKKKKQTIPTSGQLKQSVSEWDPETCIYSKSFMQTLCPVHLQMIARQRGF